MSEWYKAQRRKRLQQQLDRIPKDKWGKLASKLLTNHVRDLAKNIKAGRA